MARLLVYLFESGLCLTLFYLGYIVFFRKETYFNFNRIYLVASMVLALTMPLVPVHLKVGNSDYLSKAIHQLVQFRNYYEEIILVTDPEYAVAYSQNEGNSKVSTRDAKLAYQPTAKKWDRAASSFNLSRLLFYIYSLGLAFFALRLLLLVYNLYRIIQRNEKITQNGITIVFLKEETPSFSFLKWVFVNKEVLKPEEYEQVLTHETVHVQHKHSVDLILAHIITIFQWFNPLTWRLQKSLKTCHEYIADQEVVNKGHELFDYQSLLLSQLISIRSVGLVNNFNLLSIKKRIAMMNKIKSGRNAKIKALLIIPLLLVAFFFFAEMTGITDPATAKDAAEWSIEQNVASNMNVGQQVQKIHLPSAREVKTFDEDFIALRIVLGKEGLFCNGNKYEMKDLDEYIKSVQLPEDKASRMTVLLEIDKDVTMDKVDVIKNALRNNDLLKLGHLATPIGDKNYEGQTALFVLMPPKSFSWVDEKQIDNLFEIKQSENVSATAIADQLSDYVRKHEKYVMVYKYTNQTKYGDYIASVDNVFNTIVDMRRQLAQSKGEYYEQLTGDEQKSYRKRYPITLTMKNVDNEY